MDLQGLDFDAYAENKLVRRAVVRNLIVDNYAGIDNRIVFEILESRLRDFENFASAIVPYLASDPM